MGQTDLFQPEINMIKSQRLTPVNLFLLNGLLTCFLITCSLFDNKDDDDQPDDLKIIRTFTPVVIDSAVSSYANFSSYNQRMVANENGIFYVYIDTTNDNLSSSHWHLVKIRKSGLAMDTLYQKTAPTGAPILETDDDNNLYLMYVDIHNLWGEYRAYLLRFLANKNYTDPDSFSYPMAASYGKFAMTIDNVNRCLYYMALMDGIPLLKIDFDGNEVWRKQVIDYNGTSAVVQYPLLAVDENQRLHVAWTSQKLGIYHYWDIHHMMSDDGGETWHNMGGSALSVPVAPDEYSQALRITLDDEFEMSTWLASFTPKGDFVHFLYLAQGDTFRQHCVTYRISTGERVADHCPIFGGNGLAIQSLDGFFVTDPNDPDGPVYCIGRDIEDARSDKRII